MFDFPFCFLLFFLSFVCGNLFPLFGSTQNFGWLITRFTNLFHNVIQLIGGQLSSSLQVLVTSISSTRGVEIPSRIPAALTFSQELSQKFLTTVDSVREGNSLVGHISGGESIPFERIIPNSVLAFLLLFCFEFLSICEAGIQYQVDRKKSLRNSLELSGGTSAGVIGMQQKNTKNFFARIFRSPLVWVQRNQFQSKWLRWIRILKIGFLFGVFVDAFKVGS